MSTQTETVLGDLGNGDPFASSKAVFDCLGHTVLFREDDLPTTVLYLLEGEVKLSLNSSSGRRLILSIAQPGDTLGLSAVLSGNRHDTTAETVGLCRIAALGRPAFLDFVTSHPDVLRNAVRELCMERSRTHEMLRNIGWATAPAKLARLLIDWSEGGQKSEQGTHLSCGFTHTEIGEFIGASRETVSRIFSDFKVHELLQLRGSTLIISDRKALEAYAGIDKFD